MHIPVLLNETLEYLNITNKPQKFIDGTYGSGGHSKAIQELNPQAQILGIDLDPDSSAQVKGNYKDIDKFAVEHGFTNVDGILLDLGFSSTQLDDPGRGFSFQAESPLDMRYSKDSSLTAEKVINSYKQEELARIFKELGEERLAKRLAGKIVDERKKSAIQTTKQLAKLIGNPYSTRRIFQALRIEVNQELENLKIALPKALELLKPGGRLVVISFHSLEDRIVKWFFRGEPEKLKILTKKPITAGRQEAIENPRSRSAKLRAVEKFKIVLSL